MNSEVIGYRTSFCHVHGLLTYTRTQYSPEILTDSDKFLALNAPKVLLNNTFTS